MLNCIYIILDMCMKKWVCILILFSIPLFSIMAYINCGAARSKDLNEQH